MTTERWNPVLQYLGEATGLGFQLKMGAKVEQPGHVLVVEDVLVNQTLARSLLEKRGHIVSLASDGEDALMLMQRGQRFDVILMDLQMPGMDGFVAKPYRAEEIFGTVKKHCGKN